MGRVASNNTSLGQRGRLLWAVLALVLLSPSTAFPDAGRLQGSGRSGPFVLSLYTAPVPLRSGAVEISTLVTNAENGEPVLDATVQVRLHREGSPAPAAALTASRGGDVVPEPIPPSSMVERFTAPKVAPRSFAKNSKIPSILNILKIKPYRN